MTTLVLIAKPPVPGRAKTRLHPPLSLEQAADVAFGLLLDSIAIARATPADRLVLAWDGDELPPYARDFELLRQVPGTLDVRLGAIFDACEGPTLLIGMDTPQIRPVDLAPFFEDEGRAGGWFGPAEDGGFWSFGLREPSGDLLRGVPMSRDDTGRIQLARMRDAGLDVRMLPRLVDVDDIVDAAHVASLVPHSTFARALRGAAVPAVA